MTTARDNLRRGAPRRGFTLIELLMVILLVGVLASLLLVAINAAMRRAQNAAIQSEINQMATAVENYKAEHGAYPLTLGYTLWDNFGGNPNSNPSGQRLMRQVAKMFPRYTGNFNQLVQDVSDGTLYHPNATFSGGSARGLDVSTLDPAESLVFWLGGFPDPDSETKLIGFRADPAKPFRFYTWANGSYPNNRMHATIQQNYLKNRTPPAFPFNPERLVDRDQDGWWEYIQEGTAEGDMPPYVYFDSSTYNLRPFYPQSDMPGANAINWGHALPYATSDTQQQFNTGNTKVLWVNSQKFQIVAPGRGGSYGRSITYCGASLYPDPSANDMVKINAEVRLYPTCMLLIPSASYKPTSLPDFELDNLTNFATSELGAERE